MADIGYTEDDLRKLITMIDPDSVLNMVLDKVNFDPVKFKEFMKKFPKEYEFIYNIPLEQLMLMIDDKKFAGGFLNWRLSIGK